MKKALKDGFKELKSHIKVLTNVGQSSDESVKDFHESVLWEQDEDVPNCRICLQPFGTIKRRHHCRVCLCVYCESCTTVNVQLRGDRVNRACTACIQGFTPGPRVEEHVVRSIGLFKRSRPPAEPLVLQFGSAYPPANPNDRPVTSGYFELINKGETAVGIKVLVSCADHLWEAPRPSYVTVLPTECVHGFFGGATTLHVMLLVNNAFPLNSGQIFMPAANDDPEVSVAAITTASSSSDGVAMATSSAGGEDIPPEHHVENFTDFAVYRINSTRCNALLKYRGVSFNGLSYSTLELRKGATSARIFGSNPYSLDYRTNAKSVDQIYASY